MMPPVVALLRRMDDERCRPVDTPREPTLEECMESIEVTEAVGQEPAQKGAA